MTEARKAASKKNAASNKVGDLPDDSRVIKKYPNRRLYDTQTSAYVTLSDIKKLVMAQEAFKVVDAKTNEDLTRSILMQIILEEESAGMPIFSTESLKHIIRFYGHALQGVMAPFLETNLVKFIEMQNQYSSQSQKLGQAMTPESWMKFMQQNASSSLNPMADYMEQSKKIFETMQSQATGLFGGFPFTTGK